MWKTVQIAHGSANNCFVAASNRVGVVDRLNFWGSSFVSDPCTKSIILAPVNAEAIIVAECDLNVIDQKRDWPFLEARRIKYEQPW